MVGKDFRNALREGKKVYGTQISSTSPKMFDSVISLGLDFVFFCNEHVQYNPETLSWMCNAFKAAGVNPLVRILEPSPYLATQALDAGACTVLVPYVEEIEDVIALIGAVKYRPLKGKKLMRILHGEEKPSEELKQFLIHNNRNNSLVLNIESEKGVAMMNEYLAIQSLDGPGVDGLMIGPHDLSTSYGMPEKYFSKEFLELTEGIIKNARAKGVAVGGHTGYRDSLDLQLEWAKMGATMLLHCSDAFLFANQLNNDLNKIKKLLGTEEHVNKSSESI
ncbi:MAG: aldolase [Chitinophagia bacterium]|nr:aldolase [Chitinophagia bacterium]